jgi:hypothetical protein
LNSKPLIMRREVRRQDNNSVIYFSTRRQV